jgi:superfamily I DNA/RNA helicase
MKIIISESQKNKVKEALLELINKYGFDNTAESQGMSKLKLAKMLELEIDVFNAEDNIPVVENFLTELIDLNDEYQNCKLSYQSHFGYLEWECNFVENDKVYQTTTWATPFYDGQYSTQVDSNSAEVYMLEDGTKLDEYEVDGQYISEFENKSSFENVDDLIDWFENKYKPETYEIILNQLEQIKQDYENNNNRESKK